MSSHSLSSACNVAPSRKQVLKITYEVSGQGARERVFNGQKEGQRFPEDGQRFPGLCRPQSKCSPVLTHLPAIRPGVP